MEAYEIVSLRTSGAYMARAAEWFHQKWGVAKDLYLQSMEDCLRGTDAVPRWYLALAGGEIVGGLGVIENDFHDREDLTPNVCGVYVEEAYRKRGIAGKMLQLACDECAAAGIGTLYLITDHTSFYERYGWEFYCMVQGDGETRLSRMYRHVEEGGC